MNGAIYFGKQIDYFSNWLNRLNLLANNFAQNMLLFP
jgi:abortive infection bacteriophage resistance protein